eukprot:TRINITY_DN5751_c2_g1_i2.p1 TRINITY_DN5751_c2_g1~~TRINITY_DN5751_c2_g1_i2.p1  ORF type:complete len:144 (+),score=10.30 TRINITY_DN5751_c2_g1_i2:527-958(+)
MNMPLTVSLCVLVSVFTVLTAIVRRSTSLYGVHLPLFAGVPIFILTPYLLLSERYVGVVSLFTVVKLYTSSFSTLYVCFYRFHTKFRESCGALVGFWLLALNIAEAGCAGYAAGSLSSAIVAAILIVTQPPPSTMKVHALRQR